MVGGLNRLITPATRGIAVDEGRDVGSDVVSTVTLTRAPATMLADDCTCVFACPTLPMSGDMNFLRLTIGRMSEEVDEDEAAPASAGREAEAPSAMDDDEENSSGRGAVHDLCRPYDVVHRRSHRRSRRWSRTQVKHGGKERKKEI